MHSKTMWRHIRRSPYQALAAILIMTLTFFVVTVFTFLAVGSSKVISFFESKPQITVFFNDEAKQEQIDTLKQQLIANGKVSQIRFVSKQEALQIYRQQNKDDPLLLDLVTAEILPASLEISPTNIGDLQPLSETIKSSSVVSEVIYQKDIVSSLSAWTSAIRRVGIGLIAALALVSTFIMITIIGIKISQRKDEIEIMRLIGATNWYVRWPFIMEGIFYGVVGAFFGWMVASVLLIAATPSLSSFLRGIPLLPVSPLFLLGVLAGELLLAVIFGIFSSFLAVLRYLK